MSSDNSDSDKSGSNSNSDNDSSNEEKSSNSNSDNDSSNDDKSSGSNSDSDNSGSDNSDNSNSNSDDSSSDDSDDSGKKKKNKNKKEDSKPPVNSYFSILSTLKAINFDMDDVTKKVDYIDNKYNKGRNKNTRFAEEEKKQLMDDVDEALGNGKSRKSSVSSASKKPRNYHAPASPVRRTFQNGIEV